MKFIQFLQRVADRSQMFCIDLLTAIVQMMKRVCWVPLTAVLGLLPIVQSAVSQDDIGDPEVWLVDGVSGHDLNTGKAEWEEAFKTIEKAFSVADPGDVIWVAAGTYTPSLIAEPNEDGGGTGDSDDDDRKLAFTLVSNVSMYGGFAGTETSLSQADPVANPTILSGDLGEDGFAYHVVYYFHDAHVPPAPDFASWFIDGFIIEDGVADGTNFNSVGGGVLINVPRWDEPEEPDPLPSIPGCPRFQRCIFRNNTAVNAGGGFAANEGGVFLDRCEFRNNTQTDSSPDEVGQLEGGGSGVAVLGRAVILRSTFVSNTSAYAGGGVIFAAPSTVDAHIVNCAFFGNTASDGNVGDIAKVGTVTLIDCTFDDDLSPALADDRAASVTETSSASSGTID